MMEDRNMAESSAEMLTRTGKMQSKCSSCKSLKSCSSTTKSTYTSTKWILVGLTLILCSVPGILCTDSQEQLNHNATETGEVTDSGDTKGRPIDVGMHPLYFMTRGFLNLIQPQSKGFILDEADLLEDVSGGDFEVVLRSMGDWQMWVEHYLGFVICAVLGLVFIVVMPIVGLCFCCCRCCGNCGGKGDREEKKGDRCRRGVCGTMLFIFLLIILAGMVCAFVTNELMREQTAQDEDHALLNRISLEISSLESYKTNTLNEFRTKVLGSLDRTADNIMYEINNAADEAKDALGTITNSADMLEKAVELATTAEEINATLSSVKLTTEKLQQDQNTLSVQLADVRNDVLNTIRDCTLQKCTELRTSITSLSTTANFTQVDDISKELDDVQNVLGNNLATLVNDGRTQYEEIADKVQNDIQGELNQAADKVSSITETVETQVQKITSDLQKIHLNETSASILTVQAQVDEYGNYRYYGGMVVSCILLLVVLFGLLGLCFGICGDSAGEDAPACNRGVGATILMFGVALAFLFAWILMIAVLVLFLGGGLSYTEVCRYAVDLPNAPVPIQNTINQIVSQQLVQYEPNLNIQVTQVMQDCGDNKAIYTSLNLEQFVNISDVLNMDNYEIDEKIDDLVASVDVDLSNVVIFSNDTRRELAQLQSADLINIDFNSYLTQLNKPLTSPDLATLSTKLDATADDLESSDAGRAGSLRLYADRLDTIQDTTVDSMNNHKSELSASLTPLIEAIMGPPSINDEIQSLIDTLDNAQRNIQQNGTRLIREFIEKYGRSILVQLDDETDTLSNEIKTNIGRCRPVYSALNNIAVASCQSLLDPFNGFWFSLGMCLFFLIPLIIVSVVLVGLYRKTDEYYDDKSFDDVKLPLASSNRYLIGKTHNDSRNYDAYTGVYPGDNIPLEDINPRKHQRGGGGARVAGIQHGVHNAGYMVDDYPIALPSHNYTPRPRGEPPGYGAPGYGDDSYPLGGPHPPGDHTNPLTNQPISPPPHYTANNRPRLY